VGPEPNGATRRPRPCLGRDSASKWWRVETPPRRRTRRQEAVSADARWSVVVGVFGLWLCFVIVIGIFIDLILLLIIIIIIVIILVLVAGLLAFDTGIREVHVNDNGIHSRRRQGACQ
jgi:fatty acid desaturase